MGIRTQDIAKLAGGMQFLADAITADAVLTANKINPVDTSSGDNIALSFPNSAVSGDRIGVKFTTYNQSSQTISLGSGDSGFIESPRDGSIGDGPFTVTVTDPYFKTGTYWEWVFDSATGWRVTEVYTGTVNQVP